MTRAIRYSNHAFAQMTKRDIGRATVEAVVMSGELVRVEPSGVCRYQSFGIVVVMDGNCVITTFRDSDQEPVYSRSRKPAGRDELKRTWLKGRSRKINIKLVKCYLRQMEGNR